MEEVKYYVVLEKRLGDYNMIDVNALDIVNTKVSNDLISIDTFTCNFTEKEIRDSIKRSNMPQGEYIESPIKVIGMVKHEGKLKYETVFDFGILTKDIMEVIQTFQNSNIKLEDNLRNKLFGAYKKAVEASFTDTGFIHTLLERFKTSLRENNKEEMFKIINELPYNKSRIIFLTIYKIEMKRRSNNIIGINSYGLVEKLYDNDYKKVRKLNDAA